MPVLERGGARIHYEVSGHGPALVFAHGLGGSHLSWWQQVPHFNGRYTCVTFAHRGFAPSTDPPGGPGPRAFVDDLAALVDHLGLADIRLVAQSMGGWTCLGYALREPARVRALVMACTVGTVAHPEIDDAIAQARARGAESSLLARGITPALGERAAIEQPAIHYLYQSIGALAAGLDREAVRAALVAMRTTPPSALAALTMPVLCITGEEDVVMPSAAVATLSRLLPRARLARVPASGHSVYFERADTFNRLVDELLAEVDGRPVEAVAAAARR
jgi:pimeloyl-ACP methyl ester carboxylesterase